MEKAEKYLRDRIAYLSDEKNSLLDMVNEIDFELKETESRIKKLKNNIDDSFEIFSPRSKKNDFTRTEIESLENKVADLETLKEKHRKKIDELSEDINIIEDILDDESEENIRDAEGVNDAEEESLQEQNDATPSIDKVIEKERYFSYAKKLEENALQPISNLIHKCEICKKVIEVDTVRAKLEIEVMSGTLNEIYNKIKNITLDMKKTFDLNGVNIEEKSHENIPLHDNSSIKKISVKKLSMENFSKGNLS